MIITVRKLTFAALAAALIFVVTRIVVIPITASGAYVNFGDVSIYFIAYLLGGPVTAIAAAIGSALTDLSLGYAIYAPATFLIKGLMGLTAGFMLRQKKFWVYVMACFIGGAIMTAGYALYESFIFGTVMALANIPANLIQWGGSLIAAVILFPVAKRIQKTTFMGKL